MNRKCYNVRCVCSNGSVIDFRCITTDPERARQLAHDDLWTGRHMSVESIISVDEVDAI